MSRLYLTARSKNRLPGKWELILGRERAQLIDPEGYVEADFPLEEADKRFKMPGFFNAYGKLGIITDEKGVYNFQSIKDSIDEIHRYLAYALAQRGSGAITALKWKGWLLVFFGMAIILFSALSLVLLIVLIQDQRHMDTVFYGPIMVAVLGIGVTATGVTCLNRARAAEMEWGEDDDDEEEGQSLLELED